MHLKEHVERVELSVEGLFKLLGGNADQRARFFEILKGITTPQQLRLAENALVAAEQSLTTAWSGLAAVHGVASER